MTKCRLKPAAQSDYEDFEAHYGDRCCSCHINPPCGWCTHPGNPLNLDENEDAWYDPLTSAVMDAVGE